jgi:hypothetical protein
MIGSLRLKSNDKNQILYNNQKRKSVTGDMIRKLVDFELHDINRSDIAAFYSG